MDSVTADLEMTSAWRLRNRIDSV